MNLARASIKTDTHPADVYKRQAMSIIDESAAKEKEGGAAIMEYATLQNGLKMHMEGFGVFQVRDKEECKRSVPVSYTHLNAIFS